MRSTQQIRPGERSLGELLLSAPAVAIYLIGLALILYQRAWNFGFNSDAFVLLANAIKNPLAWDHTYHYMPVTASWLWLQYQVFGMHQAAYEILNIIQHGIMGWLVFLLGLRLNFGRLPSFLASLFFVSAGSAYQVVLWSVVGSNYFVSGCFYLGGLMLFIKAIRQNRPKLIWVVSFVYALAMLSHEQSISLLPLCYLYALLMEEGEGLPARIRRLEWHSASLKRISPMFLPLAAFFVMKYLMSLNGDIKGNWQGVVIFFRGMVLGLSRLLTFRADLSSMYWIIDAFGKGPGFLLWVIPLVILLLLLFFFGRPVEIFLGLWVLGQVFLMDVAICVAFRHLYLPTVSMALLMVSISLRLMDTFSGLITKWMGVKPLKSGVHLSLFALLAVFGFLIPASRDITHAEGFWAEADLATKSLEKKTAELAGSTAPDSGVMFLDAGNYVVCPGFEIYSFQNGLSHMLNLLWPSRFSPILIRHTIQSSNVANGSRPITAEALATLLKRGKVGVLKYDPDTNDFDILGLEEIKKELLFKESKNAVFVKAATRPELEWKAGNPSFLEITPKAEISSKIYTPTVGSTWMYAHFLDRPDHRFRIGIRGVSTVGIPGKISDGWRHEIRQVNDLPNRAPYTFFVKNNGKTSLLISAFGFLPLRHTYSARTTPELVWNERKALEIPPGAALTLPLAPCEGGDCILSLSYLDIKEHDFEVSTPDGSLRKIVPSKIGGKRWNSVVLQNGSWEEGKILIRSCGPKNAMIRRLEGIHGNTRHLKSPTEPRQKAN